MLYPGYLECTTKLAAFLFSLWILVPVHVWHENVPPGPRVYTSTSSKWTGLVKNTEQFSGRRRRQAATLHFTQRDYEFKQARE